MELSTPIRAVDFRRHGLVVLDSEDEDDDSEIYYTPRPTKDHTPIFPEDEVLVVPPALPCSTSSFSHIRPAKLTTTLSTYEGWEPPDGTTKVSESEALHDLLDERSQRPDEREHDLGFIEIVVSEFTISEDRPYVRRNKEDSFIIEWQHNDPQMQPLTNIRTRGHGQLFLSGVFQYGNVKRFVELAPFEIISIEGYTDLEQHSIEYLFVQTKLMRRLRKNIWLRLQKPAPEYSNYFSYSMWIVNFGKHVADYLISQPQTTLHHFKAAFHEWIVAHHGEDDKFQAWLAYARTTDSRTHVNRHIEWLRAEATNEAVDIEGLIAIQPLWTEVSSDQRELSAVHEQNDEHKTEGKTIVLPWVERCFAGMYFAQSIEARRVTDAAVLESWKRRQRLLGFPLSATSVLQSLQPSRSKRTLEPISADNPVRVGDVIGIERPDDTDFKASSELWYLYVNSIESDRRGPYYHGKWLWEAADTTLGMMHYPFPHELFLGYTCVCGEREVRSNEIVGKLEVVFSPQSIPSNTCFVRQVFERHEQDHCFRTLRKRDLMVTCGDPEMHAFSKAKSQYQPCDTVLFDTYRKGRLILEPAVIVAYLDDEKKIRLRKFMRIARDFNVSTARPNELAWTTEFLDVHANRIVRPCHVKTWLSKETPAVPYNRNGQVDCFLLTKCVSGSKSLLDLDERMVSGMRRGRDFALELNAQLRTLSVFSGGGNFDRGLEEAGAVQTRHVVEWDASATHTYRANTDDPSSVAIFQGSVDFHLARAIAANFSQEVAKPGAIDLLVGGSPCPAFSAMQQDALSAKAKSMASKIASFAAYITYYLPRYAILENVVQLAKDRKIKTDGGEQLQNVYKQLLCCIVGLGYQCQQFVMNSWAFGDPQKRSRIMLVFTAPGLPPLTEPSRTHSTPTFMKVNHALGKLADGIEFGKLDLQAPTTYDFLSAKASTLDLPIIDQIQSGLSVRFPDHRSGRHINPIETLVLRNIPKWPPSQSLYNLVGRDDLPDALKQYMEDRRKEQTAKNTKSWKRVDGNGLFSTVLTRPCPEEGRAGTLTHWEENRMLTVMEARRAQGYPDHEVIIGNKASQWKIVGNSVSRAVALAIGSSLRDSWASVAPGFDPNEIHAAVRDHARSLSDAHKMAQSVMSESDDEVEEQIQREMMAHRRKTPESDSQSEVLIERQAFRREVLPKSLARKSVSMADGQQYLLAPLDGSRLVEERLMTVQKSSSFIKANAHYALYNVPAQSQGSRKHGKRKRVITSDDEEEKEESMPEFPERDAKGKLKKARKSF